MKNRRSKLTPQQVVEICALASSDIPLQDIAAQYQVHPSTVSRIVSGKTWSAGNYERQEEGVLIPQVRDQREVRAIEPSPIQSTDNRGVAGSRERDAQDAELAAQRAAERKSRIAALGEAAASGIDADLTSAVRRERDGSTDEDVGGDRSDERRAARSHKKEVRKSSFTSIRSSVPTNALVQRAAESSDEHLQRAIEQVFNAIPRESWESSATGRLVAQAYDEIAGEEKEGGEQV